MTGRRSGRRTAHPRIGASPLLVVALAAAGACGPRAPAESRTGETEAVVRSVDIVFQADDEARITVVRADDAAVLRVLEPGEGGFLRGAVRPLNRERDRYGVPRDLPFTLALHADGALVLDDPPTGMTLDVAAFGPTSRAQFLTLLDGRSPPDHPTLTPPNGTMEDRP